MIKFVNLDAFEGKFFLRELEKVKSKTYDILYPEYQWKTLFPIDTEAGLGAEASIYHQFDRVGAMKIIANYADDLPRSDVFGKEFISKIKSIGGSYGYSLQEVRASALANRNLTTRKASSARASYEQEMNDIAWFADGSAAYGGLTGFLYNPNTTKSPAPTGTWAAATPDQIIADVNFLINNIPVVTLGVEKGTNTVVLPIQQYTLIASTKCSPDSDTTILEFLKKVHPMVNFVMANEVAGLNPAPSGGAGPVDVAVAYNRNPDKFQYEHPVPFEQLPVQERNLEYLVPTHARVGSMKFYYPLSVHIIEDI
jgi:hypothetical protein